MARKKTKFCLSWPNKTLKMSGRLWNIGILLTDRTIVPYWSLIFPLSPLFYRMWRHFSLDDLDTQKVPGVAECSPPPLFRPHEKTFFFYPRPSICYARPSTKTFTRSQYSLPERCLEMYPKGVCWIPVDTHLSASWDSLCLETVVMAWLCQHCCVMLPSFCFDKIRT